MYLATAQIHIAQVHRSLFMDHRHSTFEERSQITTTEPTHVDPGYSRGISCKSFICNTKGIHMILARQIRVCSLLIVVAVMSAGAATVLAHHSFAMFDQTKPLTLSGSVTEFQWTNPHAYIEIDVPDEKGIIKHWSVEMGSPSILMQSGWKFKD